MGGIVFSAQESEIVARRRFAPDPLLDIVLQPKPACMASQRHPSGRVNLHHRGFGFVTTEAEASYYIPAELARPLLAGDAIEFMAAPVEPDAASREIKSLVRVRRQSFLMLGEVCRDREGWFLRPDEPCFMRLVLPEQDALQAAKAEVVAVRIPAYDGPPRVRPIEVVLERKLGLRDRPGFSQEYALIRHGFHEAMPAALSAPAILALPLADDRVTDLSHIPFVTIDGESTRDFDDAVYACQTELGWEVRVAVADVSWYVQPGSALDTWAAERCTTVYLPGRVEPMLPELLSTGVCSLTPGEAKRAVVLSMQLDAGGRVLQRQLERAWIHSAARLTYTEVAAFMAGEGARYAGEVEGSLSDMTRLHGVLSGLREQQGKLDFDEPEPILQPQPDGSFQLTWEPRTDAHKLVEELMLLTNRVAAEMLLERYGAGLFRHQPAPEAEDWQTLRTWALTCDHELPEAPAMRALADLSAALADSDVHAAAAHRIRACMRPAKYVVRELGAPGGHFSLSFDWYTHFTSPIRRYADLLVHRLLLATPESRITPERMVDLERQVARCSERSQASRLAERMVWDEIKLQNFTARVPRETLLRARVARITPRGLRVVIQGWQCAAWLPAQALRASGYVFDDRVWVAAAGTRLQEGYSLQVQWVQVLATRPAYPELQVTLAPGAPKRSSDGRESRD